MISHSKTKEYMNMLQFLKRNKFENPGALSLILFEIYVDSKYPSNYHSIPANLLKERKIIPCKSYRNFSEFRLKMTSTGILICMADAEEQQDKNPNYKAGMFKYGPTIKKYIEKALFSKSSMIERLDKKADFEDLQILEKRMNDRIDLAATKEELENVKLRLSEIENNFMRMMLYFMPPDTDERRKIIEKYQFDKDECIKQLNLESKNKTS